MPAPKNSTSASLATMASVVIATFVITALYVGREMLIPLALAALLSFLLSPIVSRLERWIGRVGATLLAVAILFGVVGGVGWVLTRQVIDLATQLPKYQKNIEGKLKSFKVPGNSRFSDLNRMGEALKKDLPGAETSKEGVPGLPPDPSLTTVAVSQQPVASGVPKAPISPATPVPVQLVEAKHIGPLEQLSGILAPLVGPLGTGALVLLLLFCMLLQRENLRGRVIRLMGSGNISAATRGMDDAAQRVTRYLLMQLIVNASYGVVIAIGLTFIGVPNALVWGVLATVLRFIPYVGAWIASGFPILLSLAVTDNWTMPLLTIGLFVVVELVSNNVMEPLLYGSSTGVSSIALIIAAVFWTWIWGAPGLVLATPMTVCLVVMGRHVPRLAILSILLSDEEALSPPEEFFHRLLTPSTTDALDFATTWLKTNSRLALYDNVFVPALGTVEQDFLQGQLEVEQHASVLQELRDVVEDVGTRPTVMLKEDPKTASATVTPAIVSPTPAATCRVLCLPVRADRDEVAGLMLIQLLVQQDFTGVCLPSKLTTGEFIDHVEKDTAEVVCISVVAPSTVVHARYLCRKLRAQQPKVRIVVGLWGAPEELVEATPRLRESGADEVVSTYTEALAQIAKFAGTLAQEAVFQLTPKDEEGRLAELQSLHLLDTAAEPVFDAITKKLSRILNVPVALVTFVDRDRQFFKSQIGLSEDLALARQTPRNVSVCDQVVIKNDLLVVEDLARDRRFSKNSLVKEKGFRFYAGAPLRMPSGHVLGALCVLDMKPRTFGEHERRVLQVMAEEVMEAVQQHPGKLPPAPLPLIADIDTPVGVTDSTLARS